MKVCVVGLGYIGLPTACLIAQSGHEVLGVDVNQAVVDQLNQGHIHIVNETGLGELANEVLLSGTLRVGVKPEPADVFILAVPTPFQSAKDGPKPGYVADLKYVEAASRSIATCVRPGNLIILESTVPPHTTEKMVRTLEMDGADISNILVAHAPERVLPGNIVFELVNNSRIVGGLTPEAGQAAAAFYRTFVKGEVHVTDAATAELVKLMENTFRDVNIALSNEMAIVCEQLGIDTWEAIRLANLHPRVNFLRPGPGVGGHCIAVDPYFVIEAAPNHTPLIQVARRVNRRMPFHVLDLFANLTDGVTVHKVAILGASYKANVGDDRESPSLEVAKLLIEAGVEVAIHDPYVKTYNQSLEAVFDAADAVLLLTDHQVYQQLDPSIPARLVAHRLLLDARGHLDPSAWEGAGFKVARLGSGLLHNVNEGGDQNEGLGNWRSRVYRIESREAALRPRG